MEEVYYYYYYYYDKRLKKLFYLIKKACFLTMKGKALFFGKHLTYSLFKFFFVY